MQERPESAGFEQRSRDVVREVPEPERRASKVLEAAVDGPRRPVARAGAVEKREDVDCALLECPAEASDLGESDLRGGNRHDIRSLTPSHLRR